MGKPHALGSCADERCQWMRTKRERRRSLRSRHRAVTERSLRSRGGVCTLRSRAIAARAEPGKMGEVSTLKSGATHSSETLDDQHVVRERVAAAPIRRSPRQLQLRGTLGPCNRRARGGGRVGRAHRRRGPRGGNLRETAGCQIWETRACHAGVAWVAAAEVARVVAWTGRSSAGRVSGAWDCCRWLSE